LDGRVRSRLHSDIDNAGSAYIQEEGVSMMRSLAIAIFLILAIVLHVMSLGKAAEASKMLPKEEDQSIVLPSSLLKITALEFRGLASDIFFIKSMVFIGGMQQRKETPKVKEWEWKWWSNLLNASTDLDPYFFDPYYYANAFLPWDAHMTEEADRLLEKGSRYRDWDWMLPYFIGFNNFFFLQNDGAAAQFFMEASRRPEGNPMLASIASRLAFKENRTETAIAFLEEIANKTEDGMLKMRYEVRIQALRSILELEKAVSSYKKRYGRNPDAIDELVSRNIIAQLPADPYGGNYYITKDGRVRSSTSSELEPYLSPSMKARK
jgi:hypothetical protein